MDRMPRHDIPLWHSVTDQAIQRLCFLRKSMGMGAKCERRYAWKIGKNEILFL
jgi:hypothetical protein